jgi:hypothetical protein
MMFDSCATTTWRSGRGNAVSSSLVCDADVELAVRSQAGPARSDAVGDERPAHQGRPSRHHERTFTKAAHTHARVLDLEQRRRAKPQVGLCAAGKHAHASALLLAAAERPPHVIHRHVLGADAGWPVGQRRKPRIEVRFAQRNLRLDRLSAYQRPRLGARLRRRAHRARARGRRSRRDCAALCGTLSRAGQD